MVKHIDQRSLEVRGDLRQAPFRRTPGWITMPLDFVAHVSHLHSAPVLALEDDRHDMTVHHPSPAYQKLGRVQTANDRPNQRIAMRIDLASTAEALITGRPATHDDTSIRPT
jgi:hypothetical protein